MFKIQKQPCLVKKVILLWVLSEDELASQSINCSFRINKSHWSQTKRCFWGGWICHSLPCNSFWSRLLQHHQLQRVVLQHQYRYGRQNKIHSGYNWTKSRLVFTLRSCSSFKGRTVSQSKFWSKMRQSLHLGARFKLQICTQLFALLVCLNTTGAHSKFEHWALVYFI